MQASKAVIADVIVIGSKERVYLIKKYDPNAATLGGFTSLGEEDFERLARAEREKSQEKKAAKALKKMTAKEKVAGQPAQKRKGHPAYVCLAFCD